MYNNNACVLAGTDDDAFVPFGDDCPLPMVRHSWETELPALLDSLSKPEALIQKQQDVYSWYEKVAFLSIPLHHYLF